MYAEERQRAIAIEVNESGRASVNALADRFQVTSETVRRDLASLERGGHLRRVHGGAVPLTAVVSPDELGVAERETTRPEQKRRIGQAAIRFLPATSGSVIIDSGTTTVQVAAQLPADARLTVFTNSLPVAATLAARPASATGNVDLQLIGGRIRGVTQAAVGAGTVSRLAQFQADVAFIGANGLTAQHGLSTPDIDEGAVKTAMVHSSRTVVALADSSKMGQVAMVGFAGLADIDVLITDEDIAPDAAAELTAAGVEVVIA